MQRTVCIPISPTNPQGEALRETVRQFTVAFNHICAEGWRLRQGNAYTLHHVVYYPCREAQPDLRADLLVQAIQKSAEAITGAFVLERQGRKVSQPHSASSPPRYNCRTLKVYWEKGFVSIATTAGRQKVPFTIPKYAAYAAGLPTASADLMFKRGRWYLHIVVNLPDMPFEDNAQAVGVDLGITHPAVTSDNKFHGRRHWREVDKRTFRLRRRLQANGSKSAKRHLRSLAGRTARFRRDCDHVLSKRIIDSVDPGTTIVVENLANIRRRVKASRGEGQRRLHQWSFRQLKAFLEYKAKTSGCRVITVDPRHTSQRCNACGFTYRGNRRSQSEFLCRQCGHNINADLNAARNIRDRHLVGWGTSSSGGPSSAGLSCQVPSVT